MRITIKKSKLFVQILCILLFLTQQAFAGDVVSSIEEELKISELENIVPDSIKNNEILSDTISSPSTDISDNGLSFSNIVTKFLNIFIESIKKHIVFLASICAFLVICAILNCITENMTASQPAFSFVSTLILTTLTYNFAIEAFENTEIFIEDLDIFVTTLMPTLGTLYAAGGNVASAAVQNTGLFTAINVLKIISTDIILPCIRIFFALIAVSSVSGIDMSAITSMVKNTAKTICISAFTILCAILYFQTTLSSAADSLAMRSVKLAASNLIPIIGSMVGEASKTVFAGVSLIKSSVGAFAISVIIFLAAIPIISLFAKKIIFIMASGVGKLLGCKKEFSFINEIASIFDILIALCVSAVIYFIIALAIFTKTAAA